MSHGRGAFLFQSLHESQSSSSSTDDKSKQKSNELTKDSGLPGSPLSHPKQMGRGRYLDLLSSDSSAELSKPPFLAGRRASLLSPTTSSGISGSRGRGSLVQLASEFQTDKKVSPPNSQVDIAEVTTAKMEKLNVSASSSNSTKSVQEMEPVLKRGTRGVPVNAVCNYIRLRSDPQKGVFEYEVKFSPNVDSRNMRIKYLDEHRSKFGGTRTFDGVTLYLPILLPEKETVYTAKNIADGSNIKVSIIYKKKKPLRDCVHLYNVLFDRIMKVLNFVRFDRKQYDPTSPKMIPQHKLEIWPGYVTAVDEYEDGVMLCCDVSHRILCTSTVLSTLSEAYNANPNEFQENAKKALIGSVVITRYNNKTYRIDDIDFTATPKRTFKDGEKEISFIDYYKSHYNITIRDLKQPLLTSIKKRRVANNETAEEIVFSLIPELCHLTGLRDSLRSDFRVLKDIATYTRVSPNQRVESLNKFVSSVNNNKEARDILNNWGLTLENHVGKLSGRQLDEEQIILARKQFSAGQNADFGKHVTANEVLEVVNFTRWLLIYTKNDNKAANSFMDCLERNSRPMGIQVSKPDIIVLPTDKTESYVSTLRSSADKNFQIIVIICPTSRDDRYSAIKKVCCVEKAIPTQVINARTLSNESKNRAIVQKIALQMNCKIGGTLWSVKIPFNNVMICGIDTYHDSGRKGNSVAAFVASLNNAYTKWYSRAIIQSKNEEIVNGLCFSLQKALNAYERLNGKLPEKIIMYRDGVGDGQLRVVSEYEIPQLKAACKVGRESYNPLFTFVVVQKRINTRIFIDAPRECKNPNPGFIVDHTITRKYMYDFFLVSQSVRQGTVSPCHYIVVHDSAGLAPDILQRLSYKLCFLYYNWPGTVRVPACCQYAHKMAYLVGENLKKAPSEELSTKLFYL